MRDIAISIYLTTLKIIFVFCKLFPLKNKVVFLVSFTDNPKYIYEMMKAKNLEIESVFLCQKRTFDDFSDTCKSYLIESKNIIHTFKGLYHLATSKYIIADNYFGILAITSFKPGVVCTQIWHAAGAFKKFGIADAANSNRSKAAIGRFKKVYSRFNQYSTGSPWMDDIFKTAYLATDSSFLSTGIPRTDFFFQRDEHQKIISQFHHENPLLKNKKVILYAPTFRRYETSCSLNFEAMFNKLKDDYVLIIKFHPAARFDIDLVRFCNFAFDYSDQDISHLLVVADILITDYSSIPMEFCLLKKPMIFFAYDLDTYQKDSGFWESYEDNVPGEVVFSNEKLIDVIMTNEFDVDKIDAFAKKWVCYCNGNSSENFVDTMFNSSC